MPPYYKELWNFQDGALTALMETDCLIMEVPRLLPSGTTFNRIFYCDLCGITVAQRIHLEAPDTVWMASPSGCVLCCRRIGRFLTLRFPLETFPENEELMPPASILLEILANQE